MLTVERADASLKLAMQVRNKILDAYREIMRMQV
jgi:flagellar hook-basal body complex protein FliE